MAWLRSILCKYPRLAVMLVVLALAMKALIPGGYMLGFDNETPAAEVCEDTSGKHLVDQTAMSHHMAGSHHGTEDERKEHNTGHSTCPYATLTMVAVSSDAQSALIALALVYILALGFLPITPPTLQRIINLRPPLRGPPGIS